MTLKALILSAMIIIAQAGIVQAHEYMVGKIAIGHPWARSTPPAAPVAGGYLTLTNTGTEPDLLVSGSSPISEAFEVHQSTVVDGVAKMRRVDGGVEIKPGETVTLKAGGTHIMFVKPAKQLVEGDKFPVNLHFEKSGDITVDFVVQGPGKPKASEGHGDHFPKAN